MQGMRKSVRNPKRRIYPYGSSSFLIKRIMMDVLSQFKNGETSIRGVMLESYIKNGNQPIAKKGQMIPGLSVTDPCLGWQETKELILKSAEFLRKG
jgi:phospho-2-dehydro-3-deoxyheptonate aldolase